MFNLLSQYSRNRSAWFLLIASALSFEFTALYFQHALDLPPCTLCIYQRLAILGILFAGILASISPKNGILRIIAILIWLFSAFKGVTLAYQQARLQFEPTLADVCSINVEFPSWLPLNSWFPSIFNAYGSCSEKLWSFLTLEMSQWMIIIFISYVIVGLLVLLAQLFSPKKRSIWDK